MTISLTRPALGVVTSAFGPRQPGKVGSTNHLGIDFSWNKGWTIFAAQAGRVVFAGSSGGYGNLIRIDHGGGWETRYAHQSRFLVGYNTQVTAGQQIGIIGNTGASAGAHLHFELLLNGVRINPAPYFGATAGGSGSTPIEEEQDTDMKIVKVAGGTISLVGAFIGHNFRAADGFSIGAYEKAYGAETGFTEQQVAALVTDGQYRYKTLVNDVAAAVATLIPVGGPASIDYGALATALAPLLNGEEPVDVDALAAKLTTALAPQFAAVNANIDDQPIEFTISPKG